MKHPKRGTCPSCGMKQRVDVKGFIEQHYAHRTAWGGYKVPSSIFYKCFRGGLLPKELQRAVLVIAGLV